MAASGARWALWREVWPMRDAGATLAALASCHAVLRQWSAFLADWPIVVSLVSLEPPFPVAYDLRDEATTRNILRAQSPMLAASVLGLPAVSVPTGLHDGLPLGVQIMAGRYDDELCLDAAEEIEARLGLSPPIEPLAAPEAEKGRYTPPAQATDAGAHGVCLV